MAALAVVTAYFGLRPSVAPPNAGAGTRPPTAEKSAAPLSASRQLTLKARALFENPAYTIDDLVLAEEQCKQALKLDSNDAEVWAIYAELSSEFIGGGTDHSPERFELARTHAERAVKLAPASTEARFAKASYLRRVGGTSRAAAEQILRQLATELPQDPRVLIALGKVIWGNLGLGTGRSLERADEALALLGRAAAIPAGRAEALSERGWLLYNLGRYAETESAVNESLRLRPSKSAVQTKVLVSLARDDLAEARAALTQVPADFLRSDAGASLAAIVWLSSKQPDKCLEALRAIPRDYLSSNNFRGPTDALRGFAYQQDRKPQAARGAWQAALQVVEKRLAERPRADDLLLGRAHLLALLGERPAAATALQLYEETYNNSSEPNLDAFAVHALLDPVERVVALLEHAFNGRTPPRLKNDFRFEVLRGNPRFDEFLARYDTTKASDATSAPAEKSIAVLAFANRSDDKANEYFSDGITDELINVLGRVPGLTVKGRASSFYFKGSNATAQEKGSKLGVTYLVDGSVRRMGDTVRIAAQLTRAATDEVVWSSEPLNRDVKDVFAVQEEIAGLIAQALSLKLGASSAAATATVKPLAFELYLQARQAWNLRTSAGFARAEELLNRALALEPNFARAHAALADVWSIRGAEEDRLDAFGTRDSPLHRKVVAKVQQALDLDRESAEAHAALGSVLWTGWELPQGERSLRRAIELNPSYATAHQWLGRVRLAQGYADEALTELKTATGLDPLSARIADNYALALLVVGKLTNALAVYDQALVVQPGAFQPRTRRTWALHRLGRQGEANSILRGFSEQDWPSLAERVEILAGAGLRDEAAALFPGIDPRTADVALLLAHLGRSADALAALNPDNVVSTQIDQWLFHPAIDPLRGDPRFAIFLATLGLTEAHARAQAWRAAHPPEKTK